jgi:two-component system, chemotaxis family, chemotaxis protein CheY
MAKKVALVGHCGPDSSYLRLAITRSIKDATVLMADDDDELSKVLEHGVDLILFNRELGYGFSETQGVKCIARLRGMNGGTKMMLISNYPDAQAAAVAAGALPGFGKRELGTPRVTELLKAAVE